MNNFPVPSNSLLVTMDVKSLYTSIPNNEEIASVKKKYDHYSKKTIPTKIITKFLALILTLNNFIFNSKFYLQINGCAMGTICISSYVNIFMPGFEEKYIYPLIKNKSVIYFQYIDNIFMVWIKSKNELRQFMNGINQRHVNQIWLGVFKRKHRISGHISEHRQQQQTPDHHLQKTNWLAKLFTF